MAELPLAPPSAVAVIETPDYFLAEGRPDRPGALAHSGKVQFFGGHMDDGEVPSQTIRRELCEELGLELPTAPDLLWNGQVESRLRDGTPALRHVNLFHVPLASADDLVMRVPGDIVSIPKSQQGLERYQDRLTSFAYDALSKVLSGEYPLNRH